MTERKTAIPSAQTWYDSAHNPVNNWPDRVICMENAYNHTENALFAARKEIEKLRNGHFQIMAACRDGNVCDDIAWFGPHETLWEYCADLLEYEEDPMKPLPTDQPTDADREYVAGKPSSNDTPDISKCPSCGGDADNGFDRMLPPNPYNCTKCDTLGSRTDSDRPGEQSQNLSNNPVSVTDGDMDA